MLGEMAVAHPSTGSFTNYARTAMGGWAGFSTGWLYWYFWVIVIGFEAVVGGQIIHKWLPQFPVWAIATVLLVIMTMINLQSVSKFGETEYWFAGIKVFVVIAFILAGSMYVLGLWPNTSPDFSNLSAHGGITPHGWGALVIGIVLVITSMSGAEVVTIAAAESKDPAKAIRRAVNSVVFRVIFFFVLSTFLITVIVPWDQIVPGVSPFVTALDVMGLPVLGRFLDFVILTCVLSVLNTGMYSASRMLFALGEQGDAPKWIMKVSKNGAPIRGILCCTVIGYGYIILGSFFPDTIFIFLLNAAGAVTLFVYLMICLSQLVLRRRIQRHNPSQVIQFKMWFYPVLPIIVTGIIVAILVAMAVSEENGVALFQGIGVWSVLSIIYLVKKKFADKVDASEAGSSASTPPLPELTSDKRA
jgi:GABA permease